MTVGPGKVLSGLRGSKRQYMARLMVPGRRVHRAKPLADSAIRTTSRPGHPNNILHLLLAAI